MKFVGGPLDGEDTALNDEPRLSVWLQMGKMCVSPIGPERLWIYERRGDEYVLVSE